MSARFGSKQPIETYLNLSCTDAEKRRGLVEARLGYDPADPYAVTLTFHIRSAGDDAYEVVWRLGRELLRHGLTHPAGEGDVAVWPDMDDDGRASVVLEFFPGSDALSARASAHEVQHFLIRSYAAVPAGAESRHLDIDRIITQLMGTGSA